ncbi:MAG TPA: hypothetical protein VFS20_18680 [Longimicrobium sp.]|nr:hypothetical protein [Longimicrobium sp.]
MNRASVVPVAALALAACADGGTMARRLTPAQVAGVYRVCTLRFTPVQTALPPANLLGSVIDPAPGSGRVEPSLTLSGVAPQFELEYTHAGSGALRQVRGDVEYGEESVFLYLTSQSPTIVQQEALLPSAHLDLVYHPSPRRLTAGAEVSAYSVRRSDYTRAAGISEEGLQDRITGHLTAVFAEGAC